MLVFLNNKKESINNITNYTCDNSAIFNTVNSNYSQINNNITLEQNGKIDHIDDDNRASTLIINSPIANYYKFAQVISYLAISIFLEDILVFISTQQSPEIENFKFSFTQSPRDIVLVLNLIFIIISEMIALSFIEIEFNYYSFYIVYSIFLIIKVCRVCIFYFNNLVVIEFFLKFFQFYCYEIMLSISINQDEKINGNFSYIFAYSLEFVLLFHSFYYLYLIDNYEENYNESVRLAHDNENTIITYLNCNISTITKVKNLKIGIIYSLFSIVVCINIFQILFFKWSFFFVLLANLVFIFTIAANLMNDKIFNTKMIMITFLLYMLYVKVLYFNELKTNYSC